MTHGALFPDSTRPATDLGPDAPLSILGNAYDMEHLGDWTRALLEQEGRDAGPAGHDLGAAAGGRAAGLGKAALEELVRRLAPRFQLPMPLGPALQEDQRRIVELTEQKFRILNQLARNRRVVISGRAGTGKTFLALEQAQRLAASGRRTLLTCFNRALAGFLRSSAGERPNLTMKRRVLAPACARWTPTGRWPPRRRRRTSRRGCLI
jgi:carbon monoxide dehydrogenase subunit G